MLGVTQAFAKELLNLSAIEHQMAAGAAGGFGNPVGEGYFGGGTGGYNGLELDVPQGHPTDTFMIGARSGEHVSITPPGVNNSTSNKSMNFYIYGAINPTMVRNEIASYLSDEAWR